MILFHRKYEKLRAFEQEQLGDDPKALECENLADHLEKGDTLALILSALIVIIPAALLFLGIAVGIGYLFVAR